MEEALRLREEIKGEIDREQASIDRISAPRPGFKVGWALVLTILALTIVIVFLNKNVILFWIVASFVLYSFNFIIWFIPTTRNRTIGERKAKSKKSASEVKGPIWYLWKKRKALGAEIGLTMFLSGMVPLALSFFVLFGMGLFFLLYYSVITQVYEFSKALYVIVQILIILAFFIVLVIIKPQDRGLGKIAKKLKGKIGVAKGNGRMAMAFIIAIIGVIVAVIGFFFVGAILMPGGTWQKVVDFLQDNGFYNLILIGLVLVAEVIIMRHFQAVSGKRMALRMFADRVERMREGILVPLDEAIQEAKGSGSAGIDPEMLENAKSGFYSIVIYDIYEHNVFGYSPVYVVGPRTEYVLNEEVLARVK